MERHLDVIDAVEVNAMYTRLLDFNRRAIAWARANGKPLVGNTDLHVLDQMGTTYSLVGSEAEPDAICDAIRGGRVELRTSPLPEIRAAAFLSRMLWAGSSGECALARASVTALSILALPREAACSTAVQPRASGMFALARSPRCRIVSDATYSEAPDPCSALN
jgi:hypothetical protein